MGKCTFIDGIASSQALDTAGEIVDLKGLDTSSLTGAAINWEHKRDVPAQIVGKIVEIKKIFNKEDCENPRHLYFWEKIKLPFLYIRARLFDDDKESAKEVAALFRDDARHPEENDMLGFSVEGAKIEKVGAVITRSIGRLVTLANMPANKTCISEMAPDRDAPIDPNDVSELFKGEMQIFAFEPSYIQILDKKEALKKDVGSGGGAFIGSQLAMKEKTEPLMKPYSSEAQRRWAHTESGKEALGGEAGVHEWDEATKGKKLPEKVKKSNKMNKALSAGSGMAAPGMLVGGSALIGEDLERKRIKQEVKDLEKKEKSKWYGRADEAYQSWDKREKFRKYMKDRMPHLAEGEVDAIGRVLALKKSVQAEKRLSKMFASHYIKSEPMKKQASGTDVMMASEKKKE
jgi:hypothetical protein